MKYSIQNSTLRFNVNMDIQKYLVKNVIFMHAEEFSVKLVLLFGLYYVRKDYDCKLQFSIHFY